MIKSLFRPSFEVLSSAVNTANCHSTDAAPNVLKDVIVSGGAMLGRHNREDELLHYIDSYGPLVVCIQVDKKGRFAIITMNTIGHITLAISHVGHITCYHMLKNEFYSKIK